MCGICGVAGRGIDTKDLDIFRSLLLISQFRGSDSTGVAAINSKMKDEVAVTKDDCSAGAFLHFDYGQHQIIRDISNDVFIGHTRAATSGKVTKENAHPFLLDSLVGAHNGTLFDSRYYSSKKTDSEMMFEDMGRRGIKPVLDDLTEASAYAVSIYNRDNKTLYFATNGQRPLHCSVIKNKDVMFWASELEFLEFVLSRYGKDYSPENRDDYYLVPMNLYSVHPQNIKGGDGNFWTVEPLVAREIQPTSGWTQREVELFNSGMWDQWDVGTIGDVKIDELTGEMITTDSSDLPGPAEGFSKVLQAAAAKESEKKTVKLPQIGVTEHLCYDCSKKLTFEDNPWRCEECQTRHEGLMI